MPAGIGRARAAITVAIKTGHRIIAAKLQFTAEHILRFRIMAVSVAANHLLLDTRCRKQIQNFLSGSCQYCLIADLDYRPLEQARIFNYRLDQFFGIAVH